MVNFRWPFGKTYQHKCPGGAVKIVHRNIDDAFPLFIPGWAGKLDASLEAVKGAPVKLRGEYAAKIQGLLYSLDDLNNSLMMTFRASYAAYQIDPCQNDEFFRRQVEKMLDDVRRLTALKIKIRGLIELAEMNPNQRGELVPLFQSIIGELGGDSVVIGATLAIEENRALADQWIGGQNVG